MIKKKKQRAAVAMAAVLSVSTVVNPLTVSGQENKTAVTQDMVQDSENILPSVEKEKAPDIILPEALQAEAGTALQEIALPENWTWADGSTVIAEEMAEYPARFHVDDVTYDYTEAEGYNLEEHYVEVMVPVTAEPAEQEPAEPAKPAKPEATEPVTLRGNMPAAYSIGDIVINEDNFPDGEFRTWLGQQSYGSDGTITQDEIAGITEIDVHGNSNIKDLTGIGYFTALTTLRCHSTGITGLDVSKNTALTTLYCHSTGITDLDVSKNTALIDLRCHSTGINSLDVSKNTVLKGLYCKETPLAFLNIGTNGNLSLVDKSSLKPVSLEVTTDSFKMTDKFTGIEANKITNVSGADYDSATGIMSNYKAGTPITYTYACGTSSGGTAQTIDVTLTLEGYTDPLEINETNFPDEEFRTWLGKQTYGKDGRITASEIAGITMIDVHSNSNIKDLSGIGYFTALTTLHCYDTGITNLV